MKNQKGFMGMVLVVVVVILLGSFSYYLDNKYYIPDYRSCDPGPCETIQKDDVAKWETYTNSQYGFELKYPPTWKFANCPASIEADKIDKVPFYYSGSGQVSCHSMDQLPVGSVVTVSIENSTEKADQTSVRVKKELGLDRLKQISRTEIFGLFAEDPLNDYYRIFISVPNSQKNIVFYSSIPNSDDPAYGGMYNKRDQLAKILSTFKFTDKKTANLPTTCKNEKEGTPVITSISSSSASVGDIIKVHGCNLNGFEGDNTLFIESKDGIKGVLYGMRRDDKENIEVVLKSPLCQEDNSYSGLPCDAYLTLTPGVYKIYTIPWSKKSNEVSIMIK